ncbi:MAG: biotin/lipoyl-binding protein, partial [Zoogloea sp.]|nr:biotin/lipoyl-binding protein [Zoogloea sp.]
MSFKPSIRRIGMFAVLVAVLAGGVLAWQRMRPAELPPGFASGNGRLEATEVDVSTKLAGRVATLLPHEGDAVVGGAVVAGLDMADLAAQLNQAEAQIQQAKSAAAQARAALPGLQSQVELARVTLERTRQLVAKNFITGDKLDRDSSALKSAQAALEAGRAQVKVAEAAVSAAEAGAARMRSVLDDATLKAPITGR